MDGSHKWVRVSVHARLVDGPWAPRVPLSGLTLLEERIIKYGLLRNMWAICFSKGRTKRPLFALAECKSLTHSAIRSQIFSKSACFQGRWM